MPAYAIVTHTSKASDFVHPELDFDRAKAAAIHHVRSMMLEGDRQHHQAMGEVRDLETDDHETLFSLEVRDIPIEFLGWSDKEEPEPKLSKGCYAVYIENQDGEIQSHETWSNLSEKQMVYSALLNEFRGVEVPTNEEVVMKGWLYYDGNLKACAWLEAQSG